MSLRKNLLLASTLALGFTGTASALTLVGVTSNNGLVSYDSDAAVPFSVTARLSGFTAGDTTLVGIDYRVQDGALYGVGNNSGVYRIDAATGVLTYLHTLSVTLDAAATGFGVDFNPAADRLRIVSNTGQNLRHNIGTGITLLDDPLDYAPGAVLNGIGPTALGISAVAYTNNDLVTTTATTLFSIDTSLDQVALISPPNNGSLAAIGSLERDVTGPVGFDVLSSLNPAGKTVTNTGYLSINNTDTTATLFTVNLSTGGLSTIATTPRIGARLVAIAAPLGQ